MRSIFAAYRAAFSGLPRQSWILALVAFVQRCGSMVLPFLALYLKRERGFTPEEAGRFIAIWGAGAIVGSYIGGRLSDALAPRTIQISSLVGGGVMFLVLGQMRTPLFIGIALFVTAIVLESLRPANMAAVAQASPKELRTRAFGLHRLAINLGVAIGPAFGGFLAVIDYGFLFLIDGFFCIAAGLTLALLSKAPPPRAPSDPGIPTASPWSDGVYLLFLFFMFISSLVFFQLEASFPLYLNERYGLPEDRIGLMYAVNTILIVLVEMMLVKRIENFPLLRTIAVGTVLTGLGFGLLPWGQSMGFAVFTVIVWTWGEMLSSPTMVSFASQRASDANQGRYLGLLTMAFAVGFVIAPLGGTAIYQRIGGDVVWHVAFAISMISAGGLMLVEKLAASAPQRAPTAAAEQ
jgi:predicted MFS family arabinose efflux permease